MENFKIRSLPGSFGRKLAIWAHMGPSPWAHMGVGRFWRLLIFWTFWICQSDMFFWIFGSLMAPSEFFFARKMLAIGSSNFHKFTEMCQIHWVLLSWFYFSLKTHFVKLSHQGSVGRALCTFKTFGLPGPASLFIFWKYDIFRKCDGNATEMRRKWYGNAVKNRRKAYIPAGKKRQ